MELARSVRPIDIAQRDNILAFDPIGISAPRPPAPITAIFSLLLAETLRGAAPVFESQILGSKAAPVASKEVFARKRRRDEVDGKWFTRSFQPDASISSTLTF